MMRYCHKIITVRKKVKIMMLIQNLCAIILTFYVWIMMNKAWYFFLSNAAELGFHIFSFESLKVKINLRYELLQCVERVKWSLWNVEGQHNKSVGSPSSLQERALFSDSTELERTLSYQTHSSSWSSL